LLQCRIEQISSRFRITKTFVQWQCYFVFEVLIFASKTVIFPSFFIEQWFAILVAELHVLIKLFRLFKKIPFLSEFFRCFIPMNTDGSKPQMKQKNKTFLPKLIPNKIMKWVDH
jgi:hypothetical protein